MMVIDAPIRCSPELPYQISIKIDSRVNLAITPDFNSYFFLNPDYYDRTNMEMMGLSVKIISGDFRRSKNTQTQHIHAYNTIYKVQVKVITY
jgi:hypothetical protein